MLFIKVFLHKTPCNVPRVLDANDCPLHNIVHDISQFPKYYDPIYYPRCYPEIYKSPIAVKEWYENALTSHISGCSACFCKHVNLNVTYSVQWRESLEGFLVCVLQNGKLNQCMVSIKDFESSKYTHCWVLARLYEKCCSNIFNVVRNKKPIWLQYADASYYFNLSYLSLSVLIKTVNSLQLATRDVLRSKERCVSKLVDHFLLERNAYLSSFPRDDISSFVNLMDDFYGKDIAALFRETPFSISVQANRNIKVSGDSELSWCTEPVEELVHRLHSFSVQGIVSHIHNIPGHRRPTLNSGRSHRKILNSLVDHVLRRVSYLFNLKIMSICEIVLALDPRIEFEQEPCKEALINSVIQYEYGVEVFLCLSTSTLRRNDERNLRIKEKRRLDKDAMIQNARGEINTYEAAWPTQVSQACIIECLNAYREGTIWKDPSICAVCGQGSSAVKVVHFGTNEPPPFSLEILQVTDNFIIENCILKCNSVDFVFGCNIFDGFMLDRAGISACTSSEGDLNCCAECYAFLRRSKVPRMALANNLYRGVLPDQFKDLTWVEEMVCAIYRNTAHVTRLYGSSDPANPTVLHGNTCAHDMNVLSTVSVLPRTPADVNGMLSVVFVGAGKFEKKSLQNMFRIRKHKVWNFLLWLKNHNRLYTFIPLDMRAMDLYPEDGPLPGIEDRIIQDSEISADTIFLEETAGFSEHPAELFRASEQSATSSVINDEHYKNQDDNILIE